jgi:two-component system OmpR family response regulator
VKVLVIDDSAAVRDRLVALLGEQPGVEVFEAGDAREAMATSRRECLAIIVLDLHMPDVHGLALLPVLRREQRAAIVVVLTNDASFAHRRQCEESGANFFFDKSIDFERIADVVASARTGA